MLVYDEARRLASGRKRTRPVQRKDGTLGLKRMSEFGTLARMRYKFKRVVLLSGTPTPEGVIDLWGPLYIIDKGQRLGTSKSAFLQRWFRKGYDGYTWEPFDHSERQIMRIIRPVFFSLKEADYLKLPPLITRDHHVELPQRAREQYDRFASEMVLEEFDLEAVNGGVLTNKLLQMANGSVYLDDKSAKRIHDAKLDVLESIMEENYGKSVLVAYSFQFDKEEIRKRFKYVRVFGDTKNDLRDWNAGKIRMLLTHPASAGHGMNFQFGGHTGVWYGLPWSLELYLQFRKRLHRSGQEAAAVVLHRILAKYTADDAVATALDFKGARQDRITDAVKVHLANGFFLPNGYEFTMMLAAASLGIVLTGPGRFSIDALIARLTAQSRIWPDVSSAENPGTNSPCSRMASCTRSGARDRITARTGSANPPRAASRMRCRGWRGWSASSTRTRSMASAWTGS